VRFVGIRPARSARPRRADRGDIACGTRDDLTGRDSIRILDPAAGTGILLAAAVEAILEAEKVYTMGEYKLQCDRSMEPSHHRELFLASRYGMICKVMPGSSSS